MYSPRTYRALHSGTDLTRFRLVMDETDLDIAVTPEAYGRHLHQAALEAVREARGALQDYIGRDPAFLTALTPHRLLPEAPPLARAMAAAADVAGVGPMAAVAGAVAERVGVRLSALAAEVLVENGGDIWLKCGKTRRVGVYAGASPFSLRLAIELNEAQTPLGVCTSSGTVGHSLSFGCADAVVILSPAAALADAVATAAANLVQGPEDLARAVEFALAVPGVTGALAILGDKLAVLGEVVLRPA